MNQLELNGKIISGHFDQETNAFSLERLKHFQTESMIKKNQFNHLYEYLVRHKEEESGQIITLYDQMPYHLSRQEIHELLEDLDTVHSFYH